MPDYSLHPFPQHLRQRLGREDNLYGRLVLRAMRTEQQITAYYEQLAIDFSGQAKALRCRASVHLEDKDDEWYWDRMMQQHRPGKYNYLYHSIHHDGKQTSGCTQCLQFRKYLSTDFFICIDSDYRYLKKEVDLDPQHYISQTYTYSWENHFCQSERLQDCLYRKNSDAAIRFNFNLFLHEYSIAVYEPLLLFLYMDRNGLSGFSQKKFNELSALQYRDGDISNNGRAIIQRLHTALSTFITPLKAQYGFNLENETIYYTAFGLTIENAYLHFRGHNLYNIVRSIGKQLCKDANVDFEYDILLDGLIFDTYWEIERSGNDLRLLR